MSSHLETRLSLADRLLLVLLAILLLVFVACATAVFLGAFLLFSVA